MKGSAVSLALIMIAGSLAGCLATDSDGVPEISLTDDDITGLFDDYFMDFVNNSSVTVINEIHYHNNTTVNTVVNQDSYNNTTSSSVVNQNNDSSSSTSTVSIEGDGSGGVLYVLDVTFDFESMVDLNDKPDHRNRTFNVTHQYYNAALNQYVTSDFTVSCGDYYLVGAATDNVTTWWESNNNYWVAWNQTGYNDTYSEILSNNGWSAADYCDEGRWLGLHNGLVNQFFELHTIEVPSGFALRCAYDQEGVSPQQARMILNNVTGQWSPTYSGSMWGPGNQFGVQMGDSSSGHYHNCGMMYGNGSAMDYSIQVSGFTQEDTYRFIFYYELVPIIGAGSDVGYGVWINEVGNASEPWSLSLEDDEWLEVRSAKMILEETGTGQFSSTSAYVCSDSGYIVQEYAITFGDNYTMSTNLQNDGGNPCAGDPTWATLHSWSIIYRIHSV